MAAAHQPLHADHYYHRAQRPLQSLIFLLPFILVYELGAWWMSANPQTGETRHILARSLLGDLLEVFGAGASFMPGLAVVIVLLVWHIAKRDPWRVEGRLYVAMAAESVALAVPLLMFALVWGRQPAYATTLGLATPEWIQQIVYSIGAGVYEELIFRLMAIALLHGLMVDIIGIDEMTGAAVAVICSAVLFASYHFTADNPFTWVKFTFYSAAGGYLAVLFALRGFGIVAATHAFYDIFYVGITHVVLNQSNGT